MPDFPIIDTHVHLYDPRSVRFDWMAGVPQLNRPHLPADYYQMCGDVQVEAMVFAEVDAAAGENIKEALWVSTLQEPKLRGMIASAPLEIGVGVEPQLKSIAGMALARGVRRLIQGHVEEPGWCLRDDFVAAVQLLPKYGLSFDICIVHPQMADAIELIRRCPDVLFVLDHIGKPGIKDGQFEPWASQLKILASHPNVMCKVSGVVTEADHATWTEDQVVPYIKHAISCFGFDRVMFGGDWPVLTLAGQFQPWVALLDRVLADEPMSSRMKFYCDTARRVYRLE
jgi:L-fuconolactonase